MSQLNAVQIPFFCKMLFNCRLATIFILIDVLSGCKGKETEPWADLSFPEVPDSVRYEKKNHTFVRWEESPIQYFTTEPKEALNWLGIAGTQQVIRIFPNYGTRKKNRIKEINKITGVNHFFLDMDLSTGYVHDYTRNFFNKLRPDDYVMRFIAGEDSLTALMSFTFKKNMRPDDVLGKTIAFFRQWKLSELNIKGSGISTAIEMKACSYNPVCLCPTVKKESQNPFKTEVPFWHSGKAPGWINIAELNKTGKFDGGNVVVIWNYKGNTWFQEMHGSLQQVLEKALTIKAICECDPILAISDSGPMAASFKSNKDFVLETGHINQLDNLDYVGAGYGYFPSKVGVYKYTDWRGKEIEFSATY